jgi:hypothetical protein
VTMVNYVPSVNAACRSAKLDTLASYNNKRIKYCIVYFYVTEHGPVTRLCEVFCVFSIVIFNLIFLLISKILHYSMGRDSSVGIATR